MSRPHFDELIGQDLDPNERERLRRVHDLLVAAGPPPDMPPSLAHPPGTREREAEVRVLPRGVPRRRLAASIVLAAALAFAAFGAGYLLGDRGEPAAESAAHVVKMIGTRAAPGAVASLQLFGPDDAGNKAIELTVRGLEELPDRAYYELGLTRDGELVAPCGTFDVAGDKTVVSFSVPYDWSRFDGWAIVAHFPDRDDDEPEFLLTTEA